MDIFGTVVAAGQLIHTFLSSCASYSDEARSLSSRFQWDIRVIEHILKYFNDRKLANNGQLSDQDQKLLEETAAYLEILASKVAASSTKIQARGWRGTNFNRILWLSRQNDLKELERELFEWTRRFDVRILALPSDLQAVIPTISGEEVSQVIKSGTRVKELHQIYQKVRDEKTKTLWTDAKNIGDIVRVTKTFSSFQVGEYGAVPVLLEFRPHCHEPSSVEFSDLKSDLGSLAAALNCLERESGVNLLRVEKYLHAHHGRESCFVLVQALPYPISSMATLAELVNARSISGIRLPAMHALNQRFRFAQRLATAVFFLHVTGFVHKNISARTVVIFERPEAANTEKFPYTLREPYLIGFEETRSFEGYSSAKAKERQEDAWTEEIYTHPDRLVGDKATKRYINTYDVYSFGVVLLELGLWRPLSRYEQQLKLLGPTERTKSLLLICKDLEPMTGEAYRRVVEWCLSLTGKSEVKESSFSQNVLDILEELTQTLS
jgi:hypothetical protein